VNLYEFTLPLANGTPFSFEQLRGKVVLIVNTASQCGFTPQFQGLQALYHRYCEEGFVVLGFPCDQFGHQEPLDGQGILDFCRTTYDVTFPMFRKIDVNGENAYPLFKALKAADHDPLAIKKIPWNFTKFLIGRDGKLIKRYDPTVEPLTLMQTIETALHKK
jgi:glutathione peroxidase